MNFTDKQRRFLESIGVYIGNNQDISDAELISIEEKLSNILQINGFDGSYEPTEIGKLCEEILDLLSKIQDLFFLFAINKGLLKIIIFYLRRPYPYILI